MGRKLKAAVKLDLVTDAVSPNGYQWLTMQDLVNAAACKKGLRWFKKNSVGGKIELSPENMLKLFDVRIDIGFMSNFMSNLVDGEVNRVAGDLWQQLDEAMHEVNKMVTAVAPFMTPEQAEKVKGTAWDVSDCVSDRVWALALYRVMFAEEPYRRVSK